MKKILNTAAGQARIIVNGASAIIVSKVYIQYLGFDVYGSIAAIIAFVSLFALVGNAITDAAVKSVSKYIEDDNWSSVEVFICNALYLIIYVLVIGILVGATSKWFELGLLDNLGLSFFCIMLLSVALNLLAGLFSCANFYYERFVSCTMVICLSRLSYALVACVLIIVFSVNYWSVAIGSLVGGCVASTGIIVLFKRNLKSVKISFECFSWIEQRKIIQFIGWMVLVYCSSYCVSSAAIVSSKMYLPNIEIGKLGLSLQVGSLAGQLMACFSYMTSPAIYRATSKGDFSTASRNVSLLFQLITPVVFCGVIGLTLYTDDLLSLWLGSDAPKGMTTVLLGGFLSAAFASACIPLCSYYAGINKIKNYGLVCLIEVALMLTLIFWVLTSHTSDSSKTCVVAWIPAIVLLLKILTLSLLRYKLLIVDFLGLFSTITLCSIIACIMMLIPIIRSLPLVIGLPLVMIMYSSIIVRVLKVKQMNQIV